MRNHHVAPEPQGVWHSFTYCLTRFFTRLASWGPYLVHLVQVVARLRRPAAEVRQTPDTQLGQRKAEEIIPSGSQTQPGQHKTDLQNPVQPAVPAAFDNVQPGYIAPDEKGATRDTTEEFLKPIRTPLPGYDSPEAKITAQPSPTGDTTSIFTSKPTQLITREDMQSDHSNLLRDSLRNVLNSEVETEAFKNIESELTTSNLELIINTIVNKRPFNYEKYCHIAVKALAFLKHLENTIGRRWQNKLLLNAGYNQCFANVFEKLLQLEQTVRLALGPAQLDWMQQQHSLAPNHPEVVIEGAGPIGLLMALKAFQAGARVTVVEKRSGEYNRQQIVRLDPLWMQTLRFYLPEQFDDLFTYLDGASKVETDGSGNITLRDLEIALAKRLKQLIADTRSTGAVTLLNNCRLTGCQKNPDKDGYVVRAEKNKNETLDFGADLVICAGGKNSALRNRIFRHGPLTEQKFYGACTWSGMNIENQSLKTFPTIQGVSRNTGSNLFYSFSEHLINHIHPVFGSRAVTMSPALMAECAAICGVKVAGMRILVEDKKADLKPILWGDDLRTGYIHNLETMLKHLEDNRKLHDEHCSLYSSAQFSVLQSSIELRRFENQQAIYLGMELPDSVNKWYQAACQRLDALVTQRHATEQEVKSIKQQIQIAWFQSVAEQQNLRHRGVKPSQIQLQTMAMFPVIQEVNSRPEIVLGKKTRRPLRIVAAGDACASPHFMTASGLSGGRETVDAVAHLTRQLAHSPTTYHDKLNTADSEFKVAIQTIDQFVLDRGQLFLPLLTPENAREKWHAKAKTEMDVIIREGHHVIEHNQYSDTYTLYQTNQRYQLSITPWGALKVLKQQDGAPREDLGVYASFGHFALARNITADRRSS